jgi:hypothetical protein
MNQLEIIRHLLGDYRRTGGDTTDIAATTVYLNTHKPPGIGRINEHICAALLRHLGLATKPAPAAPPPAPAPLVRAPAQTPVATPAPRKSFLERLMFWKR